MKNKLFILAIYILILGCESTNKEIQDPGFGVCPKANGCECESSDTCPENSECTQLFRGKNCTPKTGSTVPQFIAIDQYGEEFDLYSLAHQGKPILLEICSSYPSSCKHLSGWLANTSDEAKEQKWWKNKFERVKGLVNNQDVHWVRIIHLDENKNPASLETIQSWHENYPNKNITILADPEKKLKTWVRPTGLPAVILVDENMVLQQHSLRGLEEALDALYAYIDSNL